MPEKINLSEIEEQTRISPKEKYGVTRKNMSIALGAKMGVGKWGGGQPFDVEWVKLPPKKTNFPCHAHQIQWEFFMVVSGNGIVRRNDQTFEVGPGDAFVQSPGTAHNIHNPSETEDLIYYVIADNPEADVVHYPDSNKWMFRPPRKLSRLTEVEYFDGEE